MNFAVDPNTLETNGPEIQHHLDRVFPVLHLSVNAPQRYWRLVRLPSDRALVALRTEVSSMVAAARARLDAEPGRRGAPADFLEAIMAAAEVGAFSDADILAIAGTLLLAGEDATANTIASTVHLLAAIRNGWSGAGGRRMRSSRRPPGSRRPNRRDGSWCSTRFATRRCGSSPSRRFMSSNL
ncbi:MAG: hypothetical protein OYH76_01865 [Defluviicoccus sp.]|nr:hypothetical protein [Defluviicoccus sp.]MDE0274610.1 hypothetical protein [Defluviicoccus sp.]